MTCVPPAQGLPPDQRFGKRAEQSGQGDALAKSGIGAKRFSIVGGGTASWLAALILQYAVRKLFTPIEITVVEPSRAARNSSTAGRSIQSNSARFVS